MRCPQCAETESRVVDSRPAESGAAIRRRRECEACGTRFTTYERLESPILIRKRDGTLQVFAADKLRVGIERALGSSEVSPDEIAEVVAEIATAVAQSSSEVTSDDIGQRVLTYLRSVDEAAYLRFASVYKDFRDASDFEREAAALDRSG